METIFQKLISSSDFRLAMVSASEATPELRWLKPIFSASLDDRVRIELDKATPPADELLADTGDQPWHYPELLHELAEKLNRCVALRSEILQLESDAVLFALDYSLAQTVEDDNERLSLTQLRAILSQVNGAGGGGNADDDLIKRLSAAAANARKARLVLHRTPGSPLNYGEQIQQLTKVYLSDVRDIESLVPTVRSGVYYATKKVLEELPKIGAQRTTLFDYLIWTRKRLEQERRRQRNVQIYAQTVFLRADGLVSSPDDILSMLQLDTDADAIVGKRNRVDIPFSLHASPRLPTLENSILLSIAPRLIFQEFSPSLADRISQRLLSPGDQSANSALGWEMRNEEFKSSLRDRVSLDCIFIPPRQQGSELNNIYSRQPSSERIDAVALGDSPSWQSNVGNRGGRGAFGLIDPVGTWGLRIYPDRINVGGKTISGLKALADYCGPLVDIALHLEYEVAAARVN